MIFLHINPKNRVYWIVFPVLDVLVNNAGVMHSARLSDLSGEDFDESMNINLKSAVILTQKAVPHMETSDVKVSHRLCLEIFANIENASNFEIL